MTQVSNLLKSVYSTYYVNAPIENGKCKLQLPVASFANYGSLRMSKMKVVDFDVFSDSVSDDYKQWVVFFDVRKVTAEGNQKAQFEKFLTYISLKGDNLVYCISMSVYGLSADEIMTMDLVLFSKLEFDDSDNLRAVEYLNKVLRDHMEKEENHFEIFDLRDFNSWPSPKYFKVGKASIALGFFGARVGYHGREGDEIVFLLGGMFPGESRLQRVVSRADFFKDYVGVPPTVDVEVGASEVKSYKFLNTVLECNYFSYVKKTVVLDKPDGVVLFNCIGNLFLYFKNLVQSRTELIPTLIYARVVYDSILYYSQYLIYNVNTFKEDYDFATVCSGDAEEGRSLSDIFDLDYYQVTSGNIANSVVLRNNNYEFESILYQGRNEFDLVESDRNFILIKNVQEDGSVELKVQKLQVVSNVSSYTGNVNGLLLGEIEFADVRNNYSQELY